MDQHVGRPTLGSALREFPHLLDYERGENHNDAADGLRGVAVLMVFVLHALIRQEPWLDRGSVLDTAIKVGGFGHGGVDLFLGLSGFLIYSGLMRRPDVRYGPFLARRLQRLYPVFLLTLGLVILLRTAEDGGVNWLARFGGGGGLLANLILMPHLSGNPPIYGVTWTLAWEWQYYLLCPLIIMGLGFHRRSGRWRVAALSLLWGVPFVIMSFVAQPGNIRFAAFGAGSIAAEWVDLRRRARAEGRTVRPLTVAGSGALLAFWMLAAWSSWVGTPTLERAPDGFAFELYYDAAEWVPFVRYWGFLATFVVLLTAIMTVDRDDSRGANRVLGTLWLRRLGVASYSFYLTHYLMIRIVMEIVEAALPPGRAPNWVTATVGMVSCFVGTLIATALVFVFVERPVSLTKDPFFRMVPPKLLRRPTWSDFFPIWTADRHGSLPATDPPSGAR